MITAIDQISKWTETSMQRWLAPRARDAAAWAERHKAVFSILMVLQIAAYSYFYTSIILTDHTIPEVWLYEMNFQAG